MDTTEQHIDIITYLNKYTKGIKVGNYPAKVIEEAVKAHFNSKTLFLQTVHFAYAVDVMRQRVCYSYQLKEYLGYEPGIIHLDFLTNMLHPDEKNKLFALYRQFLTLLIHYPIEPIKHGIVLGHQIRKSNGDFIKILRYIHPLLIDENRKLLAYYCLCVDVSHHYFHSDVTIDIITSPDAPFTREEVCAYLNEGAIDSKSPFTPRQLEVIKVWSETDSAKLAAERLSMKVRTLETHLKNLRKKLGMRRTLDVVLYAKRRGLI